MALPQTGTDVAIYELFVSSPYTWSSCTDLMTLYCRFEKYDIQRACSFLRRILPSYAFTHPQLALKFALERGTMGDVAYAALRNFTLDIADSCGVAFWHSVSKARLRRQGLEDAEALEWQSRAHYTFVQCVYAGSLQIFRCPELKSEDWSSVARTFLDKISRFEELQDLERGNNSIDDPASPLEPSVRFGDDFLQMEEPSMQDFAFPRGSLDRYFLPTQRELIKYVQPVGIVSPDPSFSHFPVHRDGYAGLEPLGFLKSSPNPASQSPIVGLLSIDGACFEMSADQLARSR
jgi:hypothetical protein